MVMRGGEPRSRVRWRTAWLAVARLAVLVAGFAAGAACSNIITRRYEYEEDVYLRLDGSATIYVNASVPALVALRDAPLPLDPAARLDRNVVRRFYQGPGVRVASVSLSRREGRRYAHLRVEADDIRSLSAVQPFAWSAYGLAPKDGVLVFTQQLTAAAGRDVGNVGWHGDELVAVRLHLPSRVPFHNAPSRTVERGNIITWEQSLAARTKGEPLDIEVHLEQNSILFHTLALFGSMAVLALAVMAFFIWWVRRAGRKPGPGHPA
ncbi:MAG TPA: hypothetical protein VMW48_19040 [Vicinamibacterales bacterium]|nr:hypothetical protein [Vicinamibacterales bacterium]